MFKLGEKFTKDKGPEGTSFGDAYALTCAQTGEVLEALHEQEPDSGFRTIDDLERYIYLQFGVNPAIIHEALLLGVEDTRNEFYTVKLRALIDELVRPRKKYARMERIMLKRTELLAPEAAGVFSNALFVHGVEPDDWGVPRNTVRPADEHIHFYYNCSTDMRGPVGKGFYTDNITVTDCIRYRGEPSLQRRPVGRIALISSGRELRTAHRFVVEIDDQWG